jgi:hypothetical protein
MTMLRLMRSTIRKAAAKKEPNIFDPYNGVDVRARVYCGCKTLLRLPDRRLG